MMSSSRAVLLGALRNATRSVLRQQQQKQQPPRPRFLSQTPLVPSSKELVSVTFTTPDGKASTVKSKVGENLLDIIIDNDVDIDGFGACEGTLACSTCHLIFKPEDFALLPDEATDEELDMLDLAYGLSGIFLQRDVMDTQ